MFLLRLMLVAPVAGRWLLTRAAESQSTPGVSGTQIKIGRTVAYGGPASATIGCMQAAYYPTVNDAGGVNGRKIDFITLDD